MVFRRLGMRIALFAFVVFVPVAARATTVVPMSFEDLTLSSRVIVDGTVVRVEPIWDSRDAVVRSYVTVDVETVLKGAVAPGPVTLRQPGGRAGGHITDVAGSPQLDVGVRVVLFLNSDRDGVLHIAHLSLGDFRVVTDDATGAISVVPGSGVAGTAATDARVPGMPYPQFATAIRATLTGRSDEAAAYESRFTGVPVVASPPEYAFRRGDGGADPAFMFLPGRYRWFQPDSGGSVPVRLNGRAAPTLSKGVEEARAALAAWSTLSGCSFRARFAGSSAGGGRKPNGVNEIAFGDPLGELDDPVNCTGVVAVTSVSASGAQSIVINGQTFVSISEADVVLNNGFDCLLSNSVLCGEVLAHEFGHATGIGHSSERFDETDPALRDATMYFVAHNDGRRTALRADDCAAARALYAESGNAKPLDMEVGALPDAVPGVPYSLGLRGTDGTTPRLWTLVSGALPDGFSLAQDGWLGGTTAAIGTYSFVVRLVDARGAEIGRECVLRVSNTPAPFLQRAVFKSGAGKLQLTGVYLDGSATIVVNGQPLGGVPVSFAARKGRLTVKGSAATLHVTPGSTNTVEVVVGGHRSNTATF